MPGPSVQVERQAPAIPIFRAQSDLKPAPLEASSSYRECKHFCEVFSSYLAAGYGGEDRIPQAMICIQLQPFVSAGWWAMMLEDDVKTKDLEGVRQTIMKVAAVHTTLHNRRLEFLRSKKENQTHSDFLRCLEEKIDLCDYKNWSRDQMVTTLFLTFCDIDMGKIVTEQMSRETLNMTELRAQVRSLESCPWYKGPKNSVKLASSGHGGNQEPQ